MRKIRFKSFEGLQMISIIIIDQGKGVLGRRGAMDAMRSVIPADTNINSLDNSNIERLRALVSEMKDEELILFINSNATKDLVAMKRIVDEATAKHSHEIMIASCIADNDEIKLPKLTPSHLVSGVSECDLWPIGCIAVRASFLHAHLRTEKSISEILIYSLCDAGMNNIPIKTFDSQVKLNHNLDDEICMMFAEQRARLLNYVVNSCNIEELFPNHPWSKYETESAAASYQTLAAIFYKLGDIQDAKECLSLSDKLEESPRSLALRALIAMDNGEALGAVANLISSLQRYEVRKRNDNEDHYLTFTPQDLEKINDHLNQGLEALNQQNNVVAAHHFAAAVFDFDDFYKENGVDALSTQGAEQI